MPVGAQAQDGSNHILSTKNKKQSNRSARSHTQNKIHAHNYTHAHTPAHTRTQNTDQVQIGWYEESRARSLFSWPTFFFLYSFCTTCAFFLSSSSHYSSFHDLSIFSSSTYSPSFRSNLLSNISTSASLCLSRLLLPLLIPHFLPFSLQYSSRLCLHLSLFLSVSLSLALPSPHTFCFQTKSRSILTQSLNIPVIGKAMNLTMTCRWIQLFTALSKQQRRQMKQKPCTWNVVRVSWY